MSKNLLFERIVYLDSQNRLTLKEVANLKKMYKSSDVDIVCACVTNDAQTLEEYIKKGYNLYICNDHVLRYTIYKGFKDVARLLIKRGVKI